MSVRSLAVLQWLGVLVAPVTWAAQHVLGYGIGQAECSPGGARWGIDNSVWELTLLACAGLLVVAAEAAAAAVFMRTRGADVGDGPLADDRFGGRQPYGRLHFFASAALVANLMFLTMMLLDGLGSALGTLCRQS